MTEGLTEPEKGQLTYNSYLKVEELIGLQNLQSDPPQHDETLFIIIHQAYELWFVRGDAPVSAGVFEADDETTTALLDGEMQPGDAIAVTVEQAGGSPSGAPTTDPIIVIPTA